jgi:hypothetical protein
MTLSTEHLEWRSLGIGGSDARVIAEGNAEQWQALKAEKVEGIRPVFSPDQRFRMDLGSACEPVLLRQLHDWVMPLGEHGVRVVFPSDPYLRCTLDALTLTGKPVQVKMHFGSDDLEGLADYYYAQLQHELMVTGESELVFAAGFGHWGRFEHMIVSASRPYQDAYYALARKFIAFCWGNQPLPESFTQGEEAKLVSDRPRLRDHVWPEGDNLIAPLARDWIDKRVAADDFKKAESALKKAVPDDARSAVWVGADKIGLKITVNKAGAKSVKVHVA